MTHTANQPAANQERTMDANQMTFGIEIETHIGHVAKTNGCRVGGYYGSGIQVPYLPEGWVAKRDGSIRPPHGREVCEIVSPILRGEDGIRQVVEVCRKLEEMGHRVNASCGVHVHVGWDTSNSEYTPAALARLICIVAGREEAFYGVTGSKNRKYGTWATSIRRYNNAKTAHDSSRTNRYHILNLSNLANGSKDTVEFRVFSGSTDAVKLTTWVRLCVGTVQRALVNGGRFQFSAPARNAEDAAKKLMRTLGWNDSVTTVYGWVDGPVGMKEAKKEMVRLAKKYDSQTHHMERPVAVA